MNDNLQFSISVGDIEIDKILVGVSSGGTGKSFELDTTPIIVEGVTYLDGGTPEITAPEKKSGLTYLYDMTSFSGAPDYLEISPIIGKNCGVSDSLSEFPECSSLL